jgi:hypothetical protein
VDAICKWPHRLIIGHDIHADCTWPNFAVDFQIDELVIPISFADCFHLTQLCTTTSANKLGACNLQTTASFNQTKPKETKSFSPPTPTAIISTFQL